MADARWDEGQVCGCRPPLQFVQLLLVLIPVDLAIGPAVAAVHAAHIRDQTGELAFIHIIIQVSAIVRRKRQLPVREGPRAAPAGYDIRIAVDRLRLPVLIERDTLTNIQPLLQDQDGHPGIGQLERREYPRRAGTDDNEIEIVWHKKPPFLAMHPWMLAFMASDRCGR